MLLMWDVVNLIIKFFMAQQMFLLLDQWKATEPHPPSNTKIQAFVYSLIPGI